MKHEAAGFVCVCGAAGHHLPAPAASRATLPALGCYDGSAIRGQGWGGGGVKEVGGGCVREPGLAVVRARWGQIGWGRLDGE